jgi:hypothetical protein
METSNRSNALILEHVQTSPGGTPSERLSAGMVVETTAALSDAQLLTLLNIVDLSASVHNYLLPADDGDGSALNQSDRFRREICSTSGRTVCVVSRGLIALRQVSRHCSDEVAQLCRAISAEPYRHIHSNDTADIRDSWGLDRRTNTALAVGKCNSFINSLLSMDHWKSELRFLQQTMRRDKLREFARRWLC